MRDYELDLIYWYSDEYHEFIVYKNKYFYYRNRKLNETVKIGYEDLDKYKIGDNLLCFKDLFEYSKRAYLYNSKEVLIYSITEKEFQKKKMMWELGM